MIEIQVKSERLKRWETVPNGPFPISIQEWNTAREMFIEYKNKHDDGFDGGWATVARDILHKVCPKLRSFDILMLGNPLASNKVKVKEVTND